MALFPAGGWGFYWLSARGQSIFSDGFPLRFSPTLKTERKVGHAPKKGEKKETATD